MPRGIWIGLLVAGLAPLQAPAADDPGRARRAIFERERASVDTRHVANWVVHSGDNRVGDNRAGDNASGDNAKVPFVIVDKKAAKVFVFHADGRLRGAAPALLGLSRQDNPVPGIGDRELSDIKQEEKTTPAGRFVARLGDNMRGEDVLWVDYDTATSMHRVINTNPKERRLERLKSPTAADNRISFGCINVPVRFYETVVAPAFTGTKGIVYVLPETKPARQLFASYDVYEPAATKIARIAAKVPAASASMTAAPSSMVRASHEVSAQK